MSGGSAQAGKGKEPADEIGMPADEICMPADERTRIQEARAAMMWGFLRLLILAFPERWHLDSRYDWPAWKQIEEDIKYVSGYEIDMLCTDPPATYKNWKKAFDAFGKEHGMTLDPCICFHGSSYASAQAIHNYGFDLERCQPGTYGGGPGKPCAYVSQFLNEALVYAQLDEATNVLWVVYGRAHLGIPQETPVGSRGQTDFGVRADGKPVITLTNPDKSYWCMGKPREQFMSSGFMGFRIATDERPSDFALLHMTYPPAVWKRMTERMPGLVAYKQSLVAKAKQERRKKRRHAAWAAAVGRREQPPRAAKRQRE
jgi:hypothetical protein